MAHESTRLIIPAPIDTRRDVGVMWYEARIDPEKQTASLEAFVAKDRKVAEATIQLRPEKAFKTVIRDTNVQLTIEARVGRDDSGVQIQGQLNGQEFEISEGMDGPNANRHLEFSAAERESLRRWALLAESCEALAYATRQSWGIPACALLYLGIGFSGAACIEGAIPACGAALTGAALAVENCL